MPKVDNLDITLPDVGDITGIPGKRLGDLDEGLELFSLQFERTHRFALGKSGKLALSASANAGYSIEVFNDSEDTDPDGIWSAIEAEDGGQRPPIWDHDRAGVATKHQMTAGLGATAAVPKLPLPGGFNGSIGIEANAQIKLANYKGHTHGDDALGALRDDVRNLRLPVVYDHIKKAVNTPGNYEVMLYRVLGTFGLGVELSWGEILSVNTVDMSTPLGGTQTIGFTVSGGAKIGFDVSLTSELELAVSPSALGVANLKFRKVKKTELGFNGRIGLTVAPKNADLLTQSVKRLVAQAAGFAEAQLDELIGKLKEGAGFDELPPRLQTIAGKLQERLDAQFDKLVDKWEAELTRYTKQVEKLALRKVEAAVTFEYERVTTSEALLDVDLWVNETAAAALYKGLLVGDFETVLVQADKPWVKINAFLRREERVSTFSYGFGLSWGDKRLIGNRTTHRFKESVQENMHGHRRIAWVSILTGDDGGPGVSSAPEITFTAAMDRFKKHPHARDFLFSFNFSWVHEQKELSQAERFEMIDLAALFGAVEPRWLDNLELLTEVETFADRGVSFTVNLGLEHEAVVAMLAQEMDAMKSAFVDGLAAGIYYWHDREWRRSFETRKCFYRNAMEKALLHEAETFPRHNMQCDGFRYDSVARRIDSMELDHARGFYRLREETIEALPTRIRPALKCWGRWKQALTIDDSEQSLRELRKAIKGIDDGFTTPLRQRALGHMIVTLLADRPDLVSSTASFVHEETGDALSYRRNRS